MQYVFSKSAWKSCVYWYKYIHRGKGTNLHGYCLRSYAYLPARTVKFTVARELFQAHNMCDSKRKLQVHYAGPNTVYITAKK